MFTLNNLLSFLDKKLLSKYSINADKKTGSSFDIIQIKRFADLEILYINWMSNDDPVFLSAFIEYLDNNFLSRKEKKYYLE
jgi:hypothetical protein